VLALLRSSHGRALLPVRGIAIAYIDLMRGIPLLLVILLISGSLPFLDFLPMWLRVPNYLGKPDIFWYGVMSITLTYGAYYAEVYRAGLEAVPYGQMEAARSLGMSHARAMRHVIVPQAIRKVIPPMLNDFIALMKDTSLVGVIALVEVVKAGREIQAENFNSSALTLGAIMFIVVTIPLARLVDRLIARQQIAMRRLTPQ
jgi:polar amino acid transport system permease protein